MEGNYQLWVAISTMFEMFHVSSNFNHFITEETSHISKEQILNKESEYISRNLRSRYKIGGSFEKNKISSIYNFYLKC